MMGNREVFWSQCRGIGLNLGLIWATPRYFTFLRWHQCSSRLVTDFWGTLCTSVKQIKTPYLFDWEQGIALQTMHGYRASSFREWEVWWFFSSCRGKLGYVLELRRGKTLKTFVCSVTSGLISSYDGHLRNLNYAWQYNTDASGVEAGDQLSLYSGTVILGFLSIFKKSQASSTFEALNSVCLSSYKSDVTPPIQMRRRTMAFSRFSTQDSDIPSSCQMKDEPAFKPLQGNPTLFLVTESRYPLHLTQKTQGPSHIPIGEGRLLFTCLFKVGLTVQ